MGELVDAARADVEACDWALNEYGEISDGMKLRVDRLILAVRAEMPCYECFVNHDGQPHNARTCPSHGALWQLQPQEVRA